MNIKHSEIQIPTNNPFENCKLERRKYADILTSIVDSYSDGFVLAINNKWGTGKTTFVKMWEQDLKNKEYKTVYFNAWENDFEDNPLTALMGELKTLTKESTEPQFKNTLKKAAILSKNIAPIIIQAIADKYIDTKGIKDAIVGVTKGLSDVFENDVNEYAKKKKSISDFKESLSKFLVDTNQDKPLIFIIDELDRCRPNYAVSILEQIKHFFSVPNIVFVLSIDKIQLGNAVKGVYGSDKIDSEEYLRRFIDLEYSIPEPDSDVFHQYLFDYYRFEDFFDSVERKRLREFNYDSKRFLKTSKILFTNKNISLRQQEKIYGLARVALNCFKINEYVIPDLFLLLIFIKITNNSFYESLNSKKLSLLEAQQKFSSIVGHNDEMEDELIWLEAYLTHYYNNYLSPKYYDNKRLYQNDTETNSNKLLINSIINKEKNKKFLDILVNINRASQPGDLELGYFLNKIELLEDIKT